MGLINMVVLKRLLGVLPFSLGIKLGSRCTEKNIIINVPLEHEVAANLLDIQAGNCTKTNFPGGLQNAIVFDDTLKKADITIPIGECDLKKVLYDEPVTELRSIYYRPTTNVTLGYNSDGVDIIYKSFNIAAECGMKTNFEVSFQYDVTSDTVSEDDGCQIIDGVCIFPAWSENARFEFYEYSSGDYTEKIVNNDARKPGEKVFLALEGRDIPEGYDWGISSCSYT